MHIPDSYHQSNSPEYPLTISIVTPTRNRVDTLERTINSVLEQIYPAIQYVIQDGGSTDGSVKLLDRYSKQFHHWESSPDSGQANAINRGFARTTGQIMAYLNSDDLLLPGSLNYVTHFFNQHPEVDVVYGHRILINDSYKEIGRWVLPRHENEILKWADHIPQETLFWRRAIWDKVGANLDQTFDFAMDWDLLLRFVDAQASFSRLPRFIGAFRIHDEQKTSAEIQMVGAE